MLVRRRYGAGMRNLGTPEARYERAMRNWTAVHEVTTVEGAVQTGKRMKPLDAMGVWAG